MAAWIEPATQGLWKPAVLRLTDFRQNGRWRRFLYKMDGSYRHTVWIDMEKHQDAKTAWQQYAGPLVAFEECESNAPKQVAAPAVEAIPAAKPAIVPTPAQPKPLAAEPTIGLHEIRKRLGISAAAFRMRKEQARYRRLAGHDREVALLNWMAGKAGPERFRQVVDALKSDSPFAGTA